MFFRGSSWAAGHSQQTFLSNRSGNLSLPSFFLENENVPHGVPRAPAGAHGRSHGRPLYIPTSFPWELKGARGCPGARIGPRQYSRGILRLFLYHGASRMMYHVNSRDISHAWDSSRVPAVVAMGTRGRDISILALYASYDT